MFVALAQPRSRPASPRATRAQDPTAGSRAAAASPRESRDTAPARTARNADAHRSASFHHDHRLDHAGLGLRVFRKYIRQLIERHAMSDPRARIELPIFNQLNDPLEVRGERIAA